jgi:hypothetical protein
MPPYPTHLHCSSSRSSTSTQSQLCLLPSINAIAGSLVPAAVLATSTHSSPPSGLSLLHHSPSFIHCSLFNTITAHRSTP